MVDFSKHMRMPIRCNKELRREEKVSRCVNLLTTTQALLPAADSEKWARAPSSFFGEERRPAPEKNRRNSSQYKVVRGAIRVNSDTPAQVEMTSFCVVFHALAHAFSTATFDLQASVVRLRAKTGCREDNVEGGVAVGERAWLEAAMMNPSGLKVLEQGLGRRRALPFHSQEWSISNFPCSPILNITAHSMKNVAFHSFSDVRWLCYQFSLPHSYISL